MDKPSSLGIAHVALTLQVTIAPERLDALLTEADKAIGQTLAQQVDTVVRSGKLGYYPALDYFAGQAGVDAGLLDNIKSLAATIRKRVKRDVQSALWPVFSSVKVERATSPAFALPRITPAQADARDQLARHYFPNRVRLELRLGSFDKQQRLENVEKFSAQKVVRNLREVFESVDVTDARRLPD